MDRHRLEMPGWRTRLVGGLHVLAVAGLCAVSAELLAGYSANTGDVGATLFDLVFFMGLYGAPALLAREWARRHRRGWPSLLLLFLALAVAQACIIDQSLFAEAYGGYKGWEENRAATFIPALGVSAYNAHVFIIGHVIFSFGAPIAIAEAWRPAYGRPWLRQFGLIVASGAYLLTGLLILSDSESQTASAAQLGSSACIVVVCLIFAMLIGERQRVDSFSEAKSTRLNPLPVFILTFTLSALGSFMAADWYGFAIEVSITAAVAVLIWWASRHFEWGVRHAAAAGLGYLLSRAVLAFTYYPLAGTVEVVPKYAHNATMLMIVLVAGYWSLRRRTEPEVR